MRALSTLQVSLKALHLVSPMRDIGSAVLAVNNPSQLVRMLLVAVLLMMRSPGISRHAHGEKKENNQFSH